MQSKAWLRQTALAQAQSSSCVSASLAKLGQTRPSLAQSRLAQLSFVRGIKKAPIAEL